MSDIMEPLILDLVQYVVDEPKPYAEIMDGWRTSCPRLTVWEDAVDQGLVRREPMAGGGFQVAATASGVALLRARGRL